MASRAGPNGDCRGLERWTIDPVARRVAVRTLNASPQEFPRPDERRFGQPYRYVFTLALPEHDDGGFVGATALYRHDLEMGTRQVHDFGQGHHPGEFVFTPRTPDAAEGDGWLMGLVVDLPSQETELVILDAMAFEGPPIARVHLPHRVPPGFHGNWLASNAG